MKNKIFWIVQTFGQFKIKIVLDGDKTEYTINVKKGVIPEKGYLNDLENRPIAQPNQANLEGKIEGEENWTSYKDKEPNVKGTKTLMVRKKATGLTTASDAITYEFTEDNQPKNRKYISIKHLTIHAFSTQSVDSSRPYYALNAIDGNLNTLWHTDFRYSVLTQDVKPFLTIKLDEVKSISALEFIQKRYRDADPILIKNATVYVSMDGEKWTQAGRIENLSQEEQVLRKINFVKSLDAQYVKLEMETYDIFASISMINLYEDKTNAPVTVPTAEVEYSTTKPTNQDVVARLVNPSTEITITNNGGKDTYTFTKNGSFTFEFEDSNGETGRATANVTWIDRKIPNATITYSTTNPTNKNVVATIKFDKENVTVEGGNQHTFTENGTYEFKFTGPAGNKGVATAKVDWIVKKEIPEERPTPPEIPKPSKPTKPNNQNNQTTSVPSTIKPITNKVEETSQNIANNKKTYMTDRVTVTLRNNMIEKDEKLKVQNLTLPSNLQEEIGSTSSNEYFEIYFETKAGQKHEINNNVIEITIQIDSTKPLLNVYALNDDGTLKTLSYKKAGTNKITIITTKLGKYILSYEKEKIDKTPAIKDSKNKETTTNQKAEIRKSKISLIIIIIIVVIVIVGVIGLTIVKKKKEEIEVI